MAVFTGISLARAREVARAHRLPEPTAIEPIAAGSVNSNFFLVSGEERWFLRIYEEQGEEGVAYEWALLDHLRASGLPAPARVPGPAPGEICVEGKPVAVFEVIGGRMSCQAAVGERRAAAVGRLLAQAHHATASFAWRREGRFTLADVGRRLEGIGVEAHPELAGPVATLRETLAEVRAEWPGSLPSGVIHGDLFRDNVHWASEAGDAIVAVIDWESASDGALVYDLAVTVLAWCFSDRFELPLARAMCRAYDETRRLSGEERTGLRLGCLAAAARFGTTRITDFHLRSGIGDRVHKDYRRFLSRLEAVRSMSAEELTARLFS